MSFDDPVVESPRKHADSIECTARLTALIVNRESVLPHSVFPYYAAIDAVRRSHQIFLKVQADAIQSRLLEPHR